MMNKIKEIFANKWVGFALASLLYTLWFVVWTANLWFLLGLVVIYDLYISHLLYKFIGRHNEELCKKSKLYNSIYEWVNSIIFAVVVATLIHTYVFQLYVIPTSSMEKSLLVGDYLYVSKVAYGPKMPNTPISFPFVHHTMPLSSSKPSFSECVKWGYRRLAGFKEVERGDVVVFNFPAGDTVLLENQGVTYYDILRSYQAQFGNERGREELFNDFTVITRPVDKRENYVKRCVAVGGDTIKIVNSKLYVNGVEEEYNDTRQFIYGVQTIAPFSASVLEKMQITEAYGNGSTYQMPLSDSKAEELGKLPKVISVTQYVAQGSNPDIFPSDERYAWNQDEFGELWIPQRGATIDLNIENLPLYRRIIDVYEDNDLQVDGDKIFINGEQVNSYTFKMNYYWMMGDNRHNSADSRFWGFVPEDHVVGRAAMVMLSLDANGRFPSNIRWNRVLKSVE